MKIGPIHVCVAQQAPNLNLLASNLARDEGLKRKSLNVANAAEAIKILGSYFAHEPEGTVLAWRRKYLPA